MEKYSLALEGGGAKGAYQVGAFRALLEQGYEFECMIGTSIGAINAAFLCQNNFKMLEELWRTLSFGDLMDVDGEVVSELIKGSRMNAKMFKELNRALRKAVKDTGIDLEKMRGILEKYIDEKKVRESDIRFGLVTFNVSTFKPEKMFIEDIPEGMLIEYLLASSNLPGFKRQKINDNKFIDGGAFDNCSVEMLYDAGYRNIVALRINPKNKIRNYRELSKKEDINLKMFYPLIQVNNTLNFETDTLNSLIEFGYIDTLKQIKKLDGTYYAIDNITKERIEKIKANLSPKIALDTLKLAGFKYKPGENVLDLLKNDLIPEMSDYVSEVKATSFKKQILDIIQYLAKECKIPSDRIYDFEDLLKQTKEQIALMEKRKIKGIDKAMCYLIQMI